jgi:hypothetical protein
LAVVYGGSIVLSGSGTWNYPDPSLIIGVKLELSTEPGPPAGIQGSVVKYVKGAGRYALLDEAGPLVPKSVGTDVLVDYDVGKSPSGLNYDLSNGAVLTATEILSETPSGGGGGTTGAAAIAYDWSSFQSVPTSTDTQLVSDTESFHTDDTILTFDGSGGVSILAHGIYIVVVNAWWDVATTMNIDTLIRINSTSVWSTSAPWEPAIPGLRAQPVFVGEQHSGDVVTLRGQQDSGSDQNVGVYWTVTQLQALP